MRAKSVDISLFYIRVRKVDIGLFYTGIIKVDKSVSHKIKKR